MPGGYFVCATPRTGSTLLCGLLASSGLAGNPESYFRVQDESRWASRFGLGDTYDYLEFVRCAREHGTTENGVFAARVMWGTLSELLDKIRPASESGSDLEVLRTVFGDLRFVHLRREDVLAQAVSWAIAEKSKRWHAAVHEPRTVVTAPAFDHQMVSDLLETIDSHNESWRKWFSSVGVQPYEVLYEDLDADPRATGSRVLQALGIAGPVTHLEVRFERLGGAVNQEWIEQYRRLVP